MPIRSSSTSPSAAVLNALQLLQQWGYAERAPNEPEREEMREAASSAAFAMDALVTRVEQCDIRVAEANSAAVQLQADLDEAGEKLRVRTALADRWAKALGEREVPVHTGGRIGSR